MRARLAFYGSTPAYQVVLDVHGWGDLQPELNTLSKTRRLGDDGVADHRRDGRRVLRASARPTRSPAIVRRALRRPRAAHLVRHPPTPRPIAAPQAVLTAGSCDIRRPMRHRMSPKPVGRRGGRRGAWLMTWGLPWPLQPPLIWPIRKPCFFFLRLVVAGAVLVDDVGVGGEHLVDDRARARLRRSPARGRAPRRCRAATSPRAATRRARPWPASARSCRRRRGRRARRASRA